MGGFLDEHSNLIEQEIIRDKSDSVNCLHSQVDNILGPFVDGCHNVCWNIAIIIFVGFLLSVLEILHIKNVNHRIWGKIGLATILLCRKVTRVKRPLLQAEDGNLHRGGELPAPDVHREEGDPGQEHPRSLLSVLCLEGDRSILVTGHSATWSWLFLGHRYALISSCSNNTIKGATIKTIVKSFELFMFVRLGHYNWSWLGFDCRYACNSSCSDNTIKQNLT